MLLKIIQLNVNRSHGAMNLLDQRILEDNIAISLVSETAYSYSCPGTFSSTNGLASIKINTNLKSFKFLFSDVNYVFVKIEDITFISCYFSPSMALKDFSSSLETFASDIKLYGGGKYIICGDFNSWSITWGSIFTSSRGKKLEE